MLLKVRKSKSNKWGYLETYKKYSFANKGYIEAVLGVTSDGRFTTPYVFRGEEFVPVSVIDEEVGIDKYIRAKKPFYTLLSDGFVVSVKVYVDFYEKVFYEEKSSFDVFCINEEMSGMQNGEVSFKRVRDLPDSINILMKPLMKELGESFGDREKFLRSRSLQNTVGVRG